MKSDALRNFGSHALPATAATFAATLLLAPLAFWQFGTAGAVFLIASAVAIELAVLISTGANDWLTRWGGMQVAVLAVMGIRMVLPLLTILAIVYFARPVVPFGAVVLVVPLYLAVLATDTVFALRRIAANNRRQIPSTSNVGGNVETRS